MSEALRVACIGCIGCIGYFQPYAENGKNKNQCLRAAKKHIWRSNNLCKPMQPMQAVHVLRWHLYSGAGENLCCLRESRRGLPRAPPAPAHRARAPLAAARAQRGTRRARPVWRGRAPPATPGGARGGATLREERRMPTPQGHQARHDRKASLTHRLCFVCGHPIPVDQGTYHADLRLLTHQGACVEAVHRESRVYDRSPRGRWRRPSDVRQRLSALRHARAPSPADPRGGCL